MNGIATVNPELAARRMEEMGQLLLAFSEVDAENKRMLLHLRETVDQLTAELSEKNRLLERKTRLAALGEMAAGMAHEIRNPLGGIQLYASLLARDLGDRPESAKLVEKIIAGVRRLESLVSQTLQFTREMKVNPVEADLAEVVNDAIEMARANAQHKKVTIAVDGPESLKVKVDPLLMGQALLNLLINAIEAVEAGGRVTVRFDRGQRERVVRQFRLLVEDNGPGIPAQILERIFNPFFTTRDHGTGLGLAIVHRVVEGHDGAITAANRPEGGARFEIRV